MHSDENSFNFVEGLLILPPVRESRSPGRLAGCYVLSNFQRAIVAQVGGNPGRSKRMAADSGGYSDNTCSAFDQCITACHGSIFEPPGLTASAAEERRPGFVGNSRNFEVGIKKPFRGMMDRHLVIFPALLMKSEPPTLAIAVVGGTSHVRWSSVRLASMAGTFVWLSVVPCCC